MLRLMGLIVRFAPRRLIEGAIATLPMAVLDRPDFRKGFIAMVREALLAGPRGAQRDTALMVSPWDFCLQDIRSAVYLWHGEEMRMRRLPWGTTWLQLFQTATLTITRAGGAFVADG
jgi:hypothetical protein